MRLRRVIVASAVFAGLTTRTLPATAQEYRLDCRRGDCTYDSRSYGRPYDARRFGDPRDLDDRRRGGDPRGTQDEDDARRAAINGSQGIRLRP